MGARENIFAQRISLLWLNPDQDLPPSNWGHTAPDLELAEIAKALSLHPHYTPRILKLLHSLTTDPAVIEYEKRIYADVLH
mgnify:FL=1